MLVNWGAVICAIFSLLLMFLSIVAVVTAFVRWGKSAFSSKLTMGCAALGCLLGSTFCSILCIVLFSYSGDDAAFADDVDASVGDYLTLNSAELHDLGAALFADAVAEKIRINCSKQLNTSKKLALGIPTAKKSLLTWLMPTWKLTPHLSLPSPSPCMNPCSTPLKTTPCWPGSRPGTSNSGITKPPTPYPKNDWSAAPRICACRRPSRWVLSPCPQARPNRRNPRFSQISKIAAMILPCAWSS